jgi:hypothetical protein
MKRVVLVCKKINNSEVTVKQTPKSDKELILLDGKGDYVDFKAKEKGR